jgi:hypothetical protein
MKSRKPTCPPGQVQRLVRGPSSLRWPTEPIAVTVDVRNQFSAVSLQRLGRRLEQSAIGFKTGSIPKLKVQHVAPCQANWVFCFIVVNIVIVVVQP